MRHSLWVSHFFYDKLHKNPLSDVTFVGVIRYIDKQQKN